MSGNADFAVEFFDDVDVLSAEEDFLGEVGQEGGDLWGDVDVFGYPVVFAFSLRVRGRFMGGYRVI